MDKNSAALLDYLDEHKEQVEDSVETQREAIKVEMLMDFLAENLNHARHVENERMTFNALFAALVGGAFGILTKVESPIITMGILSLLILINLVCLSLTERWSDVFAGHNDIAKSLYLEIVGRGCDINQYYLFDNKAYRLDKGLKPQGSRYISTRKYFRYFNLTILAILLVTFAVLGRQAYGEVVLAWLR